MATSNPASISRFAEIERQEIVAEARREWLALDAAEGRSLEDELDESGALAAPAIAVKDSVAARVRAVVPGRLGRRAQVVGEA